MSNTQSNKPSKNSPKESFLGGVLLFQVKFAAVWSVGTTAEDRFHIRLLNFDKAAEGKPIGFLTPMGYHGWNVLRPAAYFLQRGGHTQSAEEIPQTADTGLSRAFRMGKIHFTAEYVDGEPGKTWYESK